MTITQLQYLIALDRFRNFAKAASYCNVTQPTLSMQIKKLEHSLGIRLFDRSKKPMIPTEKGEFVVEQAKKIIKEARVIEDMADSIHAIPEGVLTLGIIPTVGSYLLPLFLKDFKKKYPKIRLHIKELFSSNIVQELENDDIDLGILATPMPVDGFIEDPVYYEYFVAYFSQDHILLSKNSVEPKDLCLGEMWNLSDGHCFKTQSLKICQDTQSPCAQGITFSSGSFDTIKRMVNENGGFTLIPELSTQFMDIDELSRVRSFGSPAPVREISFVTRRKYAKAHLIKLLRKEIISAIPTELKNAKRGTLVEVAF